RSRSLLPSRLPRCPRDCSKAQWSGERARLRVGLSTDGCSPRAQTEWCGEVKALPAPSPTLPLSRLPWPRRRPREGRPLVLGFRTVRRSRPRESRRRREKLSWRLSLCVWYPCLQIQLRVSHREGHVGVGVMRPAVREASIAADAHV